MHDCVVMDEVSFTVYLGALTTLIPLALGCGRIPTSEDGLLMHYRGICEEYDDLITTFEQKELLINCDGRQADISNLSRADYTTKFVAMCFLPNGSCWKNNVEIFPSSSSAVINLAANSTDCLFGLCGYGTHDSENIFFNLSRCAMDAETTSIVTTLPSASTSAQETSGAMDAETTSIVTTLPSASTSAQETSVFAAPVTIGLLVVFLIVAVISFVAYRARNPPLTKHWKIFPDNANLDEFYQPVAIGVNIMMSNSFQSIQSEFTFPYGHTTPGEVHLKLDISSQQNRTATTPAEVQNQSLAQREEEEDALPSISDQHYQQSSLSKRIGYEHNDNVIVMDKQENISIERNTDNLMSSVLVDNEDNLNIENNDPTEHEHEYQQLRDRMQDTRDGFIPNDTEHEQDLITYDIMQDLDLENVSSNHHQHTDSDCKHDFGDSIMPHDTEHVQDVYDNTQDSRDCIIPNDTEHEQDLITYDIMQDLDLENVSSNHHQHIDSGYMHDSGDSIMPHDTEHVQDVYDNMQDSRDGIIPNDTEHEQDLITYDIMQDLDLENVSSNHHQHIDSDCKHDFGDSIMPHDTEHVQDVYDNTQDSRDCIIPNDTEHEQDLITYDIMQDLDLENVSSNHHQHIDSDCKHDFGDSIMPHDTEHVQDVYDNTQDSRDCIIPNDTEHEQDLFMDDSMQDLDLESVSSNHHQHIDSGYMPK